MKKKLIYMCMIIVLVVVCTCSNFVVAVSIPRLAISGPSSGTVEVGGTIRYTVNIYNNATNVTLKGSDIRISGVTANISVEGSGNSQRTIVLSNIQGSVGSVGYISYIAGGVASNSAGGSREMNITSTSFTIVATVNNDPAPSEPSGGNDNNYNNNYNNNTTLPPSNNEEPAQNEEPEEENDDKTPPTMEIGNLSETQVEIGDTISFNVAYKDETEMGDVTLETKDITLYGFTADINISGEGSTRTVTLSNIQGNLGGLKYVKIAKKTAKDKAGNEVNETGTTSMFKVISKDTKNKPDDWIENPNTGK